MIDLYYWTTPNGHKITIFLEESELPYRIAPVNIGAGDQFKPEFLAIAPNNRIPAIVDHAPHWRRGAGLGVRIRRHPHLSSGKDGAIPSVRSARAGRGAAMAVLADGRAGADGWSEPSLHPVCAREVPVRDQSLRQRDQPAVWRLEPAVSPTVRSSRGRRTTIADMAIYPWIVPYETAGAEPRRFPPSQALVRGGRRPARRGSRL